MTLSSEIDKRIRETVKSFDPRRKVDYHAIESLVSVGDLIDKLSIVNCKLYTLKNKVAQNRTDTKMCAELASEDVFLCEERSRLRRAIDEKIIAICHRIVSGDTTGGFNPEVKRYE